MDDNDGMISQKAQYLQFIQDVITRHNTNSFKIKELTIVIIAAILSLEIIIQGSQIASCCFLLTFLLWLLDSQYLNQERRFRKLWDDAVSNKTGLYDMNIVPYKACYFKAMFSKTMIMFYLPLIVLEITGTVYQLFL